MIGSFSAALVRTVRAIDGRCCRCLSESVPPKIRALCALLVLLGERPSSGRWSCSFIRDLSTCSFIQHHYLALFYPFHYMNQFFSQISNKLYFLDNPFPFLFKYWRMVPFLPIFLISLQFHFPAFPLQFQCPLFARLLSSTFSETRKKSSVSS